MQVLASLVLANVAYYTGHIPQFEERLAALDAYTAPGLSFEMEPIALLLYHGLSGIRWLLVPPHFILRIASVDSRRCVLCSAILREAS